MVASQNFQLIGNTITKTDGYGIAVGGSSNGAVIGNVSFDNNQVSTAGDSGLLYQANAGTNFNKSVAFVGNVLFDGQMPATQKYGFHLQNSSGGPATGLTIVGNTMWGNSVSPFTMDSTIINDNSNVAIANTSWSDRQHEIQTDPYSGTTVGALPDVNPTIDWFSMGTQNGLRIVAAGRTTGTAGNKHFYLGLNSSGNLMNNLNAGSAAADWQLIAYVTNDGSFSSQHAFVQFWYNGSLISSASASTSVTTSNQTTVLLQGMLNSSSDSIVLHFLSVERI